MVARYEVIDSHTGLRRGPTYLSRRLAQRKADQYDLEYGAVRYVVRFVEA